MFNNVNFENNNKKLDNVRRFLSSKQEKLDKACRDYYSTYGDFNNNLCLVNTYFSKIARMIYDFIDQTNNEKNSKELEKIYERISHYYNKIIEMIHSDNEPVKYGDIITLSRQFYSDMYDVILELMNPLVAVIFKSFVPTQFTDNKNRRHFATTL